jgi:large subunit ribosomal protein L5
VKTTAKKAIASFKTREGMVIGAMTTLRGKKMIGFLEKFIHVVLPRTRDFKGIDPRAVDNSGNLTVAIKEHIAFPEILPEKARNIFGLEVTVVTSAKKREEGLELLRLLGFPIKI